MSGQGQLSNALRITEFNDFLSPSETCVLPMEGGALQTSGDSAPVAKLKAEPAGSVLAPIVPMEAPVSGSKRAKVTVSDCLACSGCVTSAETILLSTESVDLFRRFLLENPEERHEKYAIAGLSQQSVASLAVHYGMSLTSTARKVTTFLREELGFDAVIDMSFIRHIALLEASAEFIERYRSGKRLTVASACPGWVTYSEKTQELPVLDYMSKVRSPQGILGSLARSIRPKGDMRKVWVSTIMMCHDKKLESNRPELTAPDEDGVNRKEVDCVLTTGELVDLMNDRQFDLANAKESDLNETFNASDSNKFGVNVASGSGGYAEFVLRNAAKELFGVSLPKGPLITKKASKSGDLKTVTVSNKDGTEELQFATAYGFRCLQSVLRKMKRGQCPYHYIELMACPGGCNNGGGQMPLPENEDANEKAKSLKQQSAEHLERVNGMFSEAPEVLDPSMMASVNKMYDETLGGSVGSAVAKKNLSMSIVSRKSNTPSLSW